MTNARGRRVLLVEDDLELLQAMLLAFGSAGYEVSAAADGDEALWLFDREPHDLVVTDLLLPGRDGMEVITTVKKSCPATKVIAISGGRRAGPEDGLMVAAYVGADDTLAKPFTLEALLTLARRSLCSA